MKPILEREEDFKSAVQAHKDTFPQAMLIEFTEYWTEPNKSGSKMKWELEKTWDLKRRLHRWANNGFGTHTKSAIVTPPKPQQKPQNEIEELDEALNAYKKRPSDYTVDNLEKWYNLMQREKLFKSFTRGEVHAIQAFYNSDVKKCRGACVMKTFDAYIMGDFSFGKLLKARVNQ